MSGKCKHKHISGWNPFPWLDGSVRFCADCGKDMNKKKDVKP